MKYMFASDIHGSYRYCRQLLELFDKSGAEELILLGDLLYHGPRNALPEGYETKDAAKLLNAYQDRIRCVRGNCDAEVDQMVLEFPIMADYLVLTLNGIRFFATHGHHYNAELFGSLPPGIRSGDVLIHGHTHVPTAEKRKIGGVSISLLNPGSVSIPKGGYRNSYGLLEDRNFTVFDLFGDVIMSLSL